MKAIRFWVIAILASLVTTTAFAQDPIITKFGSDKTTRNATLLIKGSNFGTDFDAVRVEINGKKQFVTSVTPTEVWVLTDDKIPTGKVEVTLIVKGKKATAQIEVVKPEDMTGNIGSDDPGAQKKEEEKPKVIEVTALTAAKTDTALNCFQVEGQTLDLPDGARFEATISYNGKSVSTDTIYVKNNQFSHKFRGLSGAIPPGNYRVNAYFNLRRQKSQIRRDLKKNKDAEALKMYKRFEFENVFSIGSEDQVVALRNQYKAKYGEIVKELDSAFDALQEAYALSARSLFRKSPRKLNDEAWQKWLVEKGYAKDEDAAKKMASNKKFMRGVYLNDRVWKKTVQDNFEKIENAYRKILPLSNQYMINPMPRVDESTRKMCSFLMGLTIKRTRDFYDKFKIQYEEGNLAKDLGKRQVPVENSQSAGDYEGARRRANNVLNPPKISVPEKN